MTMNFGPDEGPAGGEEFLANNVQDALDAWAQIDAQHQADVHQAEHQAVEDAAIVGALAMLGRWCQARQPQW